jgi:hypothetical protein
MQEMDKGFMNINLRIATVVILCVGTCLSIPTIADAAGNLSMIVEKGLSGADNSTLTSPSTSSQELQDIYIPPNFGGPDSSEHGSGTR